MLICFVRSVVLYLVLIVVIRLMGKRQLGELEPTEFVVSILISDLASVPMQDTGIPLLAGLIPILSILAIELLLSLGSYHFIGLRRFLCGKPVILIENGVLLQKNMEKTRIHPDELTEYLRLQGITDLNTVQYAILETGGSISTLLYPKYAPACAKDAGVQTDALRLPVTLISGGKLLRHNLKLLGKTTAWLDEQLSAHNCSVENVYLLTAEPGGKLYLSIRQEL